MISLIEALNYRCLRYVRQRLDRFHGLVGPNARYRQRPETLPSGDHLWSGHAHVPWLRAALLANTAHLCHRRCGNQQRR